MITVAVGIALEKSDLHSAGDTDGVRAHPASVVCLTCSNIILFRITRDFGFGMDFVKLIEFYRIDRILSN